MIKLKEIKNYSLLKFIITGFVFLNLISTPVHANFRFVSWADTKTGLSYFTTLSNQVKLLNPAFTIYQGDLVSSGSDPNDLTTWKNASNGIGDITFAVRGNHDSSMTSPWQSFFATGITKGTAWKVCTNNGGTWNYNASGYSTCTGTIGPTNYTELTPALTYSFDYDNAHFIGVDVAGSGDVTDITSAQIAWMDQDLTAAESRSNIAMAFLYFHGPIYPIAYHTCQNYPCGSQTIINNPTVTTLINKHPIIAATFHGHEHLYAWVHINSSRISGTTHEFEQFHTGNAGAETETCTTYCQRTPDYILSNGDVHGFATVDVAGNTFTVNFYDSAHPNVSQKTMTFTKGPGGSPGPSPTPRSSPSPTPRISPTPTPRPTITPSTSPTTRNGDADGNGVVNPSDITYVLQRWLQNLATTVDQYIDNKINALDFAVVRRYLATITSSPIPTPQTTPRPTPTPGGAVVAFPGAQGFGTNTIGGRGGQVIEVTSLDAGGSGAGSFKYAISQSGPRIVVFKVGGTIDSTINGNSPQEITITNPYITIAGQTAPGDGIMLKGICLRVNTHDVIIRGMRVRMGDTAGGLGDGERDAIKLETGSGCCDIYNVVVDHNSVSWATDENMSTWTYDVGSGPPINDVTFSWNIISEGLLNSPIGTQGPHSKGLLLGDHTKRASVHHNLFVHNSDRAPEIKGEVYAEIINNIVYNFKDDGYTGGTLIGTWEDPNLDDFINVIGNLYIKGADWSGHHEIGFNSKVTSTSKVYIYDNIGPFRTSGSMDQWIGVEGAISGLRVESKVASADSNSVNIQSYSAASSSVLQSAGAISPHRDPVDTRVVNDVNNGTGHIINSESDVGGWPMMNSGTSPTDSDHDGMPDTWETANGLNPNSNDSSTKMPSGYTAIEEYINSLLPV